MQGLHSLRDGRQGTAAQGCGVQNGSLRVHVCMDAHMGAARWAWKATGPSCAAQHRAGSFSTPCHQARAVTWQQGLAADSRPSEHDMSVCLCTPVYMHARSCVPLEACAGLQKPAHTRSCSSGSGPPNAGPKKSTCSNAASMASSQRAGGCAPISAAFLSCKAGRRGEATGKGADGCQGQVLSGAPMGA